MKWTIKTFNELTNMELYQILQLRNQIFVMEQDCVYQDCDDKDMQSYHLFGAVEDEIVAYLRIVKRNISYKEVSIGRVVVKETDIKK